MQTGYWHGEDAAILFKNKSTVTFVIGSYTPEELDRIKNGVNNADPDICDEYNALIMEVDRAEWNSQQSSY